MKTTEAVRPGSVPSGRVAREHRGPQYRCTQQVPWIWDWLLIPETQEGYGFPYHGNLALGPGEGLYSTLCIGKFPRCLVATRSPLPQAEQMCSNIWSGRVYAFKDPHPHT